MDTLLHVKQLVWFYGEWDEKMLALIAFMAIEIFSTILASASKKLTKRDFKQEFAKRLMLLLVIGIGNIVDCYLANGDEVFRTIAILFYIRYEGSSIFENAKLLGLPVPDEFLSFLTKVYNDKSKNIW